MAENEIRLRRQAMSAGKLKNYRNYALLLKRHKRDMMIKQAIRFMVYFLIIALLLTLSFVLVYNVKKQEMQNQKPPVQQSQNVYNKVIRNFGLQI
jgi:hypothetical protein